MTWYFAVIKSSNLLPFAAGTKRKNQEIKLKKEKNLI